MVVKVIVWTAFVLLFMVTCKTGAQSADQARISVTGNGYTGVVVAIRDDVRSSFCQPYVDYLKEVINNASSVLFEATEGRLYYKSATIVLPNSWSSLGYCSMQISSNYDGLGWEDGHVRLGPVHPLFGNQPWTQQPRVCGQQADFIYITEQNLLRENANSGRRLVHEWAKLRWGVFEEYGHHHDPVFPSAYHADPDLWLPTACTDYPVPGNWSGQCGPHDAAGECVFQPDPSLPSTANTSLMAAPFLPSVTGFCTEESHDAALPTKHNLYCHRRSVWDVISRHEDLQRSPGSFSGPTTFYVVWAPISTSVSGPPEGKEGARQFSVAVWASQGLDTLTFTPITVPTIFVMVTSGWRHIVYADISAHLSWSGGNISLTMHDDGVAGDVTGNDGVYSAFLTPVTSFVSGEVLSIQVSAGDGGQLSRLVGDASGQGPTQEITCCGSVLDLSGAKLEDPGLFKQIKYANGILMGELPYNLPPGRVTDLRSHQEGSQVTLSFTAPGGDLDQDKADVLVIKTEVDGRDDAFTTVQATESAGTAVKVSLRVVECGVMHLFSVLAVDAEGNAGGYSNQVREVVPCPRSTLSPGAITGIVFAVIFVLAVAGLSVYLYLHHDRLEDLRQWCRLTCDCLRSQDDDLKDRPLPSRPPASRQDNIYSAATDTSPQLSEL